MHAYGNDHAGTFTVAAARDNGTVTVTVTDAGGGMVPRPDSPGLGLGLPLIASLADAVEMRPGPGGLGTAVSMLFGVTGGPTRTAGA
jgi:serine/threonine-protein kinase RsbW/stage II sporulation protein AB (anti-sigma F factor)